jgi:serine/threonine protein kinase
VITDYNELLGQALGTCTLRRLLGRGGMGAVYLAQQSRPRRTVAVKVLMPSNVLEKKSRAEFLTRFRREADAIAALDHVNIMPIYEYGEQGDIAYLVMPYVNGGTLRDVLEKRGVLSLDEVVHIIEQAAAALDIAHAQGIIHRDLKPGNMLFHADGRLLLADFGLAKVLRDLKDPAQSGQSDLTSTGTIVGTPEYLSPEQGTGRPIDHHSDIYSLGIVLFQMLGGRVPFTGTSPVAVAIKHALEEPPSLTQMNPSVPSEVEAVVMKTLAKEPEDRYNSAGEMAEALRTAVYGQDAPPTPSYFSAKTFAVRPEPVVYTDNTTEPEAKMHDALTEAAAPIVPEPVPLSPPPATNPIQGRDPDFHGSPTEAAPRVFSQRAEEEAIPTVILSHEANVVQPPNVPVPIQEPRVKVKPTTTKRPEQQGGRVQPVRGCQSISMMLLGSVLTLLVVVGLFASYLIYIAPNKHNPTTQLQAKQTVTPTTTASASKPTQKGALNLPGPAISAGAVLYSTNLPGISCDTRGGKWRNSGGIQANCSGNTTILTNTGGSAAGIYLDKLPNQSLPSSYIIQVQVDTSASHGAFDIYFFNQSGSQGWDRFQVDLGAGTWTFDEYFQGNLHNLASGTVQQKAATQGTITVNVQIQGNNSYTLYTNGTQDGTAIEGNYTSGGMGLGVESGAQVAFKNLAIYALS